jgi:hypothetical protein
MKITKNMLSELIKEEYNIIKEAKYAAVLAGAGNLSPQEIKAYTAKGYVQDPDNPDQMVLPHGNGSKGQGSGNIKKEIAALEQALNQIKAKLGIA